MLGVASKEQHLQGCTLLQAGSVVDCPSQSTLGVVGPPLLAVGIPLLVVVGRLLPALVDTLLLVVDTHHLCPGVEEEQSCSLRRFHRC